MGAGPSVPSTTDRLHELLLERRQQRPVNLLIIGEPKHGKSSLIDSIYMTVTGNRNLIAQPAGNETYTGGNISSTTIIFRRFKIDDGLAVFDGRGFSYTEANQLVILQYMLHGIKKNQKLPCTSEEINEVIRLTKLSLGPDYAPPPPPSLEEQLHDISVKYKPKALEFDKANAIDFVFIVADASKLHIESTGGIFFSAQVRADAMSYFKQLFEVVTTKCKSGLRPFMVLTNKDRAEANIDELKRKILPLLDISSKFCITNYTKSNPAFNSNLERDILVMLVQMMTYVMANE